MRRIRFDVSVAIAVIFLVTVPAAITLSALWLKSGRMAEDVASGLFADKAAIAESRLREELEAAEDVVANGVELEQFDTTEEPSDKGLLTGVPYARRVLNKNSSLYSVYVGYRNGSFMQLLPVRDNPRIAENLKAPPGTKEALRVISYQRGKRVQHWQYLDDRQHVIAEQTDPEPSFDPRSRPWFVSAWNSDGVNISKPYIFNSIGRAGITVSRPLSSETGVVAADFTLEGLGRFVEQEVVSENGAVFLMDGDGHLLAAPNILRKGMGELAEIAKGTHPYLSLAAEHPLEKEGRVYTTEYQGTEYLAQFTRIGQGEIIVCVVAPLSDFTAHVRSLATWVLSLSLAILVLGFPFGAALVRILSARLRDLSMEAERVREMDFSGEIPENSVIEEFYNLGQAFKMMKDTMLKRTRSLEAAQSKLVRLLDIGIAMGSEKDLGLIIETVVMEAVRISNAEGGTLFLLTEDDKNLRFEFIHNRMLEISLGGSHELDFDLPTIPYLDPETGKPDLSHVVCAAIHQGKSLHVKDVYASADFDFENQKDFDARTGYRTRSVLVVPLRPRGGQVIGAIQLINAHEKGVEEPVAFSYAVSRHVESLAAQSANALYNRSLLDAQENLVDAMVRIIAGAIDAKSPYTGGHCERVPELAVMLAEEAARQTEGPLAEFAFKTDDEWREFRIGAWLHDCGKVTTPEYVVDKATKLETIHNRIHDIRTRFEVLLRDAEIARLKTVAEGGDPAQAQAAYDARAAQLASDFSFIAECNIGGEFMAPEKIERLKSIAAQTWMRHFDDRLGLSFEESDRLRSIPKAELPVFEPLLSDRPEQVIPWSGKEKFTDREWGFTLTVPEVMYNRGEVHNLCIARGTLTEEERFKVSEHVIQTLMMMESLPFPKHLRHVPDYAGTHHETLSGKGYPRSLDEDKLTIPQRILAIADIFEALTAADRPYKRAKPLSVCVDILAEFRDNGSIDPVLFELFLRSGAYRRYAEQFLAPSQLDEVDISKYLH